MLNDIESFDGADDLLAEFRRGLKPPPDLLLSDWSDEHRILDKPFTKTRMKWRTEKVPYMREIMDCQSARSPVKRTAFMKSAQVSGTESGNNWIGYVIHHSPGLMMIINPTKAMVKRMSARVQALIDSVPVLSERVLPARSRDSGNTQFMKKFPGGLLVLVGSQSAPDLRSYACQYLFFDELDAMALDVGGEGSPVEVAEARTFGQGDRYKIFLNSTPLIEQTSMILKEWVRGDQRFFFMRCPFSNRLIRFEFKYLFLETPGRYDSVGYRCPCGCEQVIKENLHKTDMMAAGVWVPRVIWGDAEKFAQLEDGDRTELDAFNATSLERSYHINALYSPIGWFSWRRIMRQWDDAQGSPEKMKTFKNTIEGLCWREIGEAPDPEVIFARRSRTYRQRMIPVGVLMLTAGVDIGVDHIEVSIYGWGRRRQRWLIEHIRIDGPYNEKSTWDRLDDLLERRYEHANGAIMAIKRVCIDRGKWTDTVDAWVTGKDRGRFSAIKGYDHLDTVFRWSGARKQNKDGTQSAKTFKLKWAMVGVSYLKLELMGLLNLKRESEDEVPAGWIHLPDDVTMNWVKQLASERLEYKSKKGKRKAVWEEITDRHEALDCTNYARAAAAIEGWDDWSEIEFRRLEDQLAEAADERRVRLYEWQERNGGVGTIYDAIPGLVGPAEVPNFNDAEKGVLSINQTPQPAKSVTKTDAEKSEASAKIGIVGCKVPVVNIPLPDFGSFGDEDEYE